MLIMDPYHINNSIPKVLFSLKGHTERINAVSWLTVRLLVTVSTDKSIIIWGFNEGSDPKDPISWNFKKVFQDAHASTINYLSTYAISEEEMYILSMCSSGTLKLWQGTSEKDLQFKGELLFGKNLQETMSLQKLGDKHLLLVVGGYDVNIHVYLVPRVMHQVEGDQKIFKYKFSLTGHKNALRDLTFSQQLDQEISYLASASQDHYVRLWKIQPLENVSENMGGHDDLQQYESKTSYVLQDDEETKVYNITLESVLTSHQESVSSVRWGIRSDRESKDDSIILKDLCLLTASFDFTVCIWKPDLQSAIWSADSTLGAMAGNKHAYFDALFLEDDQRILAFTYHGAMHQWNKKSENDHIRWIPELTIKGHFAEVVDLDWDQYDACLITTSQDQTTRLFSQFGKDNGWFEFGRPQVHGYDMNTVATVKVNASVNLPSKILSGGDEKVLRLFEPPFSLVKIINSLHPDADKLQLKFNEQRSNEEIEKLITSEAKKQPLGLMNKPVMLANEKMRVDDDDGGMGPDFDPNKFLSNIKDKSSELVVEEIKEPPVEDVLMVKTLWPEQQKLYGHAYEIFCVATSNQGDCAASACKAKEKKYADIIIWDLRKGQSPVPSCKLATHTLTVVQIEFSKCGLYILSCSRDRSWALFKRPSLENLEFSLLMKTKDAHTRIIWGVSWSHDDLLFVTASREKQKSIKVWNGISDNTENIGSLHSQLPEENPSATAVRFFPSKIKKSQYSIIVGLETGEMLVWSYFAEDKKWQNILAIPEYFTHCATVRRIKFNQRLSNEETDEYIVATCGNDNTVRILKIKVN